MINLVKDQLVKLLGAALPDSQVIYGPATSVSIVGDRILTVGNIEGDDALDSMTGETESERYIVELIISVDLSASHDQQTCTEMAVADFYAAKRALREYPGGFDLGLGPGDIQVVPTTRFQLQEQADREGRHCMIKFGASVLAQNT